MGIDGAERGRLGRTLTKRTMPGHAGRAGAGLWVGGSGFWGIVLAVVLVLGFVVSGVMGTRGRR